MELHLDNDQINELLRSVSYSGQASHSEGGDPDAIEAHLVDCVSCRERVQAHKAAMRLISHLQSAGSGPSGPDCPNEGVWWQIAAGIEIECSAEAVEHACNCDHCGPLLRQAAADFQEELTPEEERRIAGLASSTAKWQKEMAARLSGSMSERGSQPKTVGGWSRFRRWLSPLNLAFAAALAGVGALTILDYHLTGALSTERQRSATAISMLEQQLRTDPQNLELHRQSPIGATDARRPEKAPALSSPPAVQLSDRSFYLSAPVSMDQGWIASAVLESGLTRGTGQLKRISLLPGTQFVKLTLHLPQTPQGQLHEELLTADGRRLWAQSIESANMVSTDQNLTIVLAAGLLPPNDYQIIVSQHLSNRIDQLGTYVFLVTP